MNLPADDLLLLQKSLSSSLNGFFFFIAFDSQPKDVHVHVGWPSDSIVSEYTDQLCFLSLDVCSAGEDESHATDANTLIRKICTLAGFCTEGKHSWMQQMRGGTICYCLFLLTPKCHTEKKNPLCIR